MPLLTIKRDIRGYYYDFTMKPTHSIEIKELLRIADRTVPITKDNLSITKDKMQKSYI